MRTVLESDRFFSRKVLNEVSSMTADVSWVLFRYVALR